jgi:hypothetical protein
MKRPNKLAAALDAGVQKTDEMQHPAFRKKDHWQPDSWIELCQLTKVDSDISFLRFPRY